MKRVALILLVASVLYFPGASAGPVAEPTSTGCLDVAGKNKGKITKVAPGSAPLGGACGNGFDEITLGSGDITSVEPGQLGSLGGGGESGDVVLEISQTYRLPQGCNDGQIPFYRSIGIDPVWQCANPGGSQAIAFRAHRSGVTGQSLTGPGATTIALGAEDFDQSESFASDQFVAPLTGVYRFEARVQIAGSSGHALLLRATTELCRGNTAASSTGSLLACSVQLNSGETVALQAFISGASATVDPGSALTFFSGSFVG